MQLELSTYPKCICQRRCIAENRSQHSTGGMNLRSRFPPLPSPILFRQRRSLSKQTPSILFAFSCISFSYAIRRGNETTQVDDEMEQHKSYFKYKITSVMCVTTSLWISFSLICSISYIHLRLVMLNQRSPSLLSDANSLKMNKIIPPVLLCTTSENGRHRLCGRQSTSESKVFTHSFSIGPK